MITTAESCTGGLISASITEIAGSSAIFDRSFITYSNEAKQEMLDVSKDVIQTHGAVSEECAAAMAKGALRNSNANLAVSVTGIAGPNGGTKDKPVGLVYIGVASQNKIEIMKCNFEGSRDQIRTSTVNMALNLLTKAALAI